MASVEIANVRKSYGPVVALTEINIQIKSGSFYTLLGPSGCGKTTLLRTIAGFHFQDSGTIKVNGQSIEKLPAHKRHVGMVFQDYAVFPHLSVRDNVAFGLKQQKFERSQIKPAVNEALRMTQMESFAERMPHELSGGQQQRVGLARAFAVDPSVMLMDEPLSNLDAKLRVDLRAELRRIQQEMGMTTVYVTHDQEEALAMSDTVCVMYGGVIQQAASPFEIYKNPSNRFVANFVGTNNFLQAQHNAAGTVELAGSKIADGIAHTDANRGVVVAIRPEDISVQGKHQAAKDGDISLPARVQHVSFIGREAEVAAVTEKGDQVKTTVRPTPEVLSLSEGSEIVLTFNRNAAHVFVDEDTGRRLT